MRIERVPGTAMARFDEPIITKHLLELARPGQTGVANIVGIKNPAGIVSLEVHTVGIEEYDSCCRFWVYLGYVRSKDCGERYAAVFEREAL